MRVFDTSAWIERLIRSPLGLRLDREFPPAAECVVPTLVQLELEKWLSRERSQESANRLIAYTTMCIVVPLDTIIALRAANLCRLHRLSSVDAMIYATALLNSADLVTCDRHFEGLAGVAYFPKPPRHQS